MPSPEQDMAERVSPWFYRSDSYAMDVIVVEASNTPFSVREDSFITQVKTSVLLEESAW